VLPFRDENEVSMNIVTTKEADPTACPLHAVSRELDPPTRRNRLCLHRRGNLRVALPRGERGVDECCA